MKADKLLFAGAIAAILLLASCASQQSLQEYYVDNSENPDFLSLSIPASVLNLDEVELTDQEKEVVSTLRKFNILAFRIKEDNLQTYQEERKKVKEILKQDGYTDLIKFNMKEGKGILKYQGEANAIDEILLFGDSKEQGFILVRILGDDMNPAHAQFMIDAMKKSNFDGKGLEALGEFMKDS